MVKFYQHIEKLLAQHDYVVVPNLGGFIVQMQSAKILSNRITPPHATIGFNPLMHHADGLLAIEISRTEQISYRKAVESIDKEVENIKVHLNNTGSAVIGDLGILQKTENGSLLFNPIYNSNFLPQNLGLFDLYLVNNEVEKVKENKKVTFTIPSSRTFKYAAASILVFGLLFISPQVNDMRQTDNANLASLNFEKKVHNIAPNSVKMNVLDSVPETEIKFKISVENISSEAVMHYHVIVASLPTQSSATKLCDGLIHEKFEDAHVLSSSKRYRVAIQSFIDRKLAIEFMENLRKSNNQYETAWVYCDK